MEYDLHSDIKVVIGISPQAALGASTDSAVIDTVGFESLSWIFAMGTITTGTFATVFEESDVVTFGGEETVVPADNQIGASPSFLAADDDQVRRVGIIGKKQFQRCTLVGSATPVAVGSVVAILSDPKTVPVPDQSVAP